jgi:enoyl-CoA hydratase/carnithine racemase
MTGPKTVLYEKHDCAAVITLNRPLVVNAFNVRMRDELWDALCAVRDDDEVRGLVICGAGERGFCAGADLSEFGTAPSQATARYVRWARDVWGLLLHMPKPTIAALHGYCFGSGVEIAALCDLRIGVSDTVFAMPEVGLGLMPAAGGTVLLGRLIREPGALDWILTGRRIGAAEAEQVGLLDWVVAPGCLLKAARSKMDEALRAPPDVLAGVKHAVNEGMDTALSGGLKLERLLASRASLSHLSETVE